MADATVVESWFDDANPALEFAELTLTDGETYQSRKFNKIKGAWASVGEDVDAHINCVVSGGQVTVNYAGATDKKVYLMIYGRP